MARTVLGVTSPISWNGSSCLVIDGEVIAFAEEERFNEIKHSKGRLVIESVEFVLSFSGLKLEDIDEISIGWLHPFSYGPRALFQMVKENRLEDFPRELVEGMETAVALERWKREIARRFDCPLELINKKIRYYKHHLCHAASAVLISGFESTNFMVFDGRGEYLSGCIGVYKNNNFKITQEIPIAGSLGAFYSEITSLCGFSSHSHEGKTMGLAPTGRIKPELYEGIFSFSEKGYNLHKDWRNRLIARFDRRKVGDELNDLHRSLAATAQFCLENALVRIAKSLWESNPSPRLTLAGGTFLNCDANSLLLKSLPVDDFFITPPSNDAGVSMGAALLGCSRKGSMHLRSPCRLPSPYLGPEYSDSEIEELLCEAKIEFEKFDLDKAVELLANGMIVARFSGRMEMGPRALGNRSILANPSFPGMQGKINKEVKHREAWRPFAPMVLSDRCNSIFLDYKPSPYMLQTFVVRDDWVPVIPAVVHCDNTSRVQEVSSSSNYDLYLLMTRFFEKTGIPVLLNTSFNDKEKPITCNPRQALQAFYSTGIDALILGNFLIKKRGI